MALAALGLGFQAVATQRGGLLVVAGVLVGLAGATRLNGLLLGVMVVLAFLLGRDLDWRGVAAGFKRPDLWFAGLAALVTLLLLQPYLVTQSEIMQRTDFSDNFGYSLQVARGTIAALGGRGEFSRWGEQAVFYAARGEKDPGQGERALGAEVYEMVALIEPHYAIYNLLARLAYENDQWAKTLSCWETSLEPDTGQIHTLRLAGQMAYNLEHYPTALSLLMRAVELDPKLSAAQKVQKAQDYAALAAE